MPQLDSSTYFAQIFWLIICISCIYLSMRYVFIPRIIFVIEKRKRKVSEFYKNAKKLDEETEQLKVKYDSELKHAYIEANKIHKEKISEFESKCSLKLQKIQNEHASAILNTRRKVREAREKFYTEIPGEVDKISLKFQEKLSDIITK